MLYWVVETGVYPSFERSLLGGWLAGWAAGIAKNLGSLTVYHLGGSIARGFTKLYLRALYLVPAILSLA